MQSKEKLGLENNLAFADLFRYFRNVAAKPVMRNNGLRCVYNGGHSSVG